MFTVNSLTAVDFLAWAHSRKKNLRRLKDLSEDEFLALAREYGLGPGYQLGNWESTYQAVRDTDDDQSFVRKCKDWSQDGR